MPEAWQGRLQYSLAGEVPPGATIDPQSGVFSWTPPADQPAGTREVTVLVRAPDGRSDQRTFTVTATPPEPSGREVLPRGKELSFDLGGGVKLEMVLIPAGEFLMGSPDSAKDALDGEKPQHRVRISKPFYLGKYLVTQEQWEAVMGDNPSKFKGPRNPVERVSWEDCQVFLGKLNEKFRRPHPSPLPAGEGEFRLPTEAQWEYACRAGSTTRYCFGDTENGLGEYAWYGENSDRHTHPVGEKKPNAWGLHDMHGNVWECCQDWYDKGYYARSPTDDPMGPTTGWYRVPRGGGYSDPAGDCPSAYRYRIGPRYRRGDVGLRVSRVLADIPLVKRPTIPPTTEYRMWSDVTGKFRFEATFEGFQDGKVRLRDRNGRLREVPPEKLSEANRKLVDQERPGTSETNQGIPPLTPANLSPTPNKEIAVDLSNGVKLEMVLIPAGEFLMGSPESDRLASDDEKPQHRVRISKPFYLGKYLVTQEQWEAVMGDNPSKFKGPRNPVERVSWEDCQVFLGKLNEKFRRPHPSPLPAGEGEFRLPTEAQWEYACRAGSTTRYCFGDTENGLGEYAWYIENSGRQTHPVGEKKPNAWGLYDMHGNVWEWCQDWYDSGYYAKSPTDGPMGPTTALGRVDRGGGWFSSAGDCRSAFRGRDDPGGRADTLGLRVSLVRAGPGPDTRLPEPAARLKIQAISPEPIEAGKPLTVAVSKEITVNLGKGVKLELLLVPAGSFTMGSPKEEKDRSSDEGQVSVTISKGFYLGRTSVTQAQFKAVMEATPWAGKPHVEEGDDYPATYVDWKDAAEFCRKLTAASPQ